MKLTNFAKEGIWLKGNLHAHSTNSDGELPPERLASEYRKFGYNFLALSDHNIYSTHEKYNSRDFVMIPGFELSSPIGHINILQIGVESNFAQNEEIAVGTMEQFKGFLAKHRDNYLIMLNHPSWSMLEWEKVIDLDEISCVEVYNHGCEWLDLLGESSDFWETMLRKGKKWWGIATDDNHNGYKYVSGWPFNLLQTDSFGGWICVKAKECTHEAIMAAVVNGSFYSSTGPEIYDFYVQNGYVYVSCSPCERVIFSGNQRSIRRVIATNITEFNAPLKENEKYVRVQCADKYGRVAYGNPIFL